MVEMLLCGHCHEVIESGQRCFAKTRRGDRYCEPCWQIVNADEIALDAKIDRWHTGYFAKERPTDPDELEGWLHRQNEPPPSRWGTPDAVVRPEGYYHMPLGTFD